jgi:putative transposase
MQYEVVCHGTHLRLRMCSLYRFMLPISRTVMVQSRCWPRRTTCARWSRMAGHGYAGELVEWAATLLGITLAVVKRPITQKGFVVLARRWVVEQTIAWLNRCRRLSKDFEHLVTTSAAMVYWASIQLSVADGKDALCQWYARCRQRRRLAGKREAGRRIFAMIGTIGLTSRRCCLCMVRGLARVHAAARGCAAAACAGGHAN